MRTTIQLDERLVERMRRFVPGRGMNRFIGEAVTARVAELERAELETAMKEGYLAARRDRRQLNSDWQATDVESWPA